jgi:mono/diheme cytochrome c family protein
MKTTRIAMLLGSAAMIAAVAASGLAPHAKASSTAASPARVGDFLLVDQNLVAHELYRLGDAPAIVLVTQQNGDAVIRGEAGQVNKLAADYGGKGVEFMMLNSSLKDGLEAIQAEAAKAGYKLPVLMDDKQIIGEALGVSRSGEAIVIDPKTWQVAYHGAVAGLPAALDALLAHQSVPAASGASTGAQIAFPARSQHAGLTYVKDVAPILEKNCVGCHSTGGIGPFAMSNYSVVKGFAPMIAEVIRTDRMPPYHADPRVGHFSDSKRLSPDEIKTLVHWVEAGAPRGEGADPLGKAPVVAADWPLGKPDLILSVPQYKVPAGGAIAWQRPFVLNPETQGHWIRASSVKPGDRQAVHHVLTGWMTEAPKNGIASEDKWRGSVGRYAVGSEADVFDKDVGTYLPAGGAVGFQMHYTPYGKAVTDNTQIGIYFTDKVPKYIMREIAISDPTIDIPPGEAYHREMAYLEFPKDALLYSAFVHAHYRATASDLWIQYPDGKQKLLLSMPRYDFNWQRAYTFAEPLKVPAGAKLIAHYWYDNSKRNPHNPDPSIHVTWGEQSWNEMLFTQLEFRWMDETSANQINSEARFLDGRLMGFIDKDLDGKIEKSELRGQIGNMLLASFDAIDTNHDGAIDKAELKAGQSKLQMFGGKRNRNAAEEFNGPGEGPVPPTPAASPTAGGR